MRRRDHELTHTTRDENVIEPQSAYEDNHTQR
jgi:hypothetical protein